MSIEANDIFLPFASGVDLFFVISGFIMVYTTYGQNGPQSAAAFARNRFLRIWPAYFAVSLIAMMIAGGFAFWLDGQMLRQFLLSIAFVPVNSEGIFSGQALSVGWTLNYEVYFYLVFGLALLAGRHRWTVMAAWFITTLILIPLLFQAPSLWNPRANFGEVSYPFDYMLLATNPIIWEFVGGMIAGIIFFSPLRMPSRMTAYALAVIAICLAVANAWFFYLYLSLAIGFGFVLLIAALAIASKTVELAVPRWMRWLGDISYTLYIEHLIVIELIRQVLAPPTSLAIGAAAFAVTVGTCVLIAGLTSPLLERRLPEVFKSAFPYLRAQAGRDRSRVAKSPS